MDKEETKLSLLAVDTMLCQMLPFPRESMIKLTQQQKSCSSTGYKINI